MTVCNMSIEGGARAGLIAPDETTFAYLQGPPDGAQGAAPGSRPSPTGARCPPTRAPSTTRRSRSTPPPSSRRSPGAPAPGRGADHRHGARPQGRRERRPARRAMERALDYMGLKPGTPMERGQGRHASSSAPAPTAGSRTCAWSPRWSRARKVAAAVQRHGRPRLRPGEAPGRGRGPGPRSSSTPASNGASPAARCAWA